MMQPTSAVAEGTRPSREAHLLDHIECGKKAGSSAQTTGIFTIEVLKSRADVLGLRGEWQQMSQDPNADLDFYLTVLESRKEVLAPHVVVLRRDGVIESILAGRMEKTSLSIKFGYMKFPSPQVRVLTLVHGGLLGNNTAQASSLLIDSIKKSLADNEADVAWFHGMSDGSIFCSLAKNAGKLFTRDLCPMQYQRWRMRVPASYEQYLRQRSGRTRKHLKWHSKRLRESIGDKISVRIFRAPDELDTLMSDTEAVASQTYQRGLGVGFIADDLTRELTVLAAARGWLRAYVLYVAGKPCAFWNGFLYRRTFFIWTTAFDPAFSELRPGMFLLQWIVESLCKEQSVDEVDFGFGDALYKREVSDFDNPHTSLFLFAPTLKGVWLNLYRSSVTWLANSTRSLLVHSGALDKVKKVLRNRLASLTE